MRPLVMPSPVFLQQNKKNAADTGVFLAFWENGRYIVAKVLPK